MIQKVNFKWYKKSQSDFHPFFPAWTSHSSVVQKNLTVVFPPFPCLIAQLEPSHDFLSLLVPDTKFPQSKPNPFPQKKIVK